MELSGLRQMIDVVQKHKKNETEFTIYMLQALLTVAEGPALTQKELLGRLDIAQGNIARVCATLGGGTPRKQGLGLIVGKRSPSDWRCQQYFLTKKGLLLIAMIQDI